MISKRKSVLALTGFALAAMVSVAPAHAQTAPKVKLTTSLGDIVVQLDPAKAPKTVENFLAYVNDKHYDGTVFHRVIDGFMIQGGGFTADMVQKPTKAPIPLEANNGLKNDTYTIAMARTGNPNSATSQFFINVKDNAMLNAPKTVENFLAYVNDKHYDGTVFHRVIDGFMIQGGGFTADMQQKPTKAPIALEAKNGLKNDTYTIAMARTGDPNSATSQFFINVKDNAMLNAPNPDGHGYAVFGKVVEGTAVVDKIKAVATGNKGPHQNVPNTPVTITSATVVK